jgi:hypothetical protein
LCALAPEAVMRFSNIPDEGVVSWSVYSPDLDAVASTV